MKDKIKFDWNKIINIVIVLGILVRLVYVCYTDYDERQHDIEPEVGHIAYIEQIYNNWSLADHNNWQFYHPPLHHFISAVWMKIVSFSFIEGEGLLQSLKVLPFIYSVLILIISKKILQEFEMKDKHKLLIMLILAFHPALIYTSAWINNDPLTYVLTFAIILYLIKWIKTIDILFKNTEEHLEKDKSSKNTNSRVVWKNTIILAILMGCCAMTKLNGVLIAVPIAVMFVYTFTKYIKNNNIKKYIVLLVVFAIISLSLGLWYPIRNYIKFGQTLTYVPQPGSSMYVGDYGIYDRFISIPKAELFDEVFCDLPNDHSLISFVIKSAIFGEYNYFNPNTAQALKIFNIFLTILITIAIIRNLLMKNDEKLGIYKIILLIIHFTNIISFIYFNIQKPYACTMDFRYILITVFTGATLLGIDLENMEESKYYKVYLTLCYVVVILFSFLSAKMFLFK